MPDEQSILVPIKPMLRANTNSAAGRVREMAARFHSYLELNGGGAEWQAKIVSDEPGEAYDPALEATVFEAMEAAPPHGWKPWNFACLELTEQPSALVKTVRGVPDGEGGALGLTPKPLKPPKPTKAEKVKETRDLRSMFDRKLAALRADPTPLQKAWMSKYTLKLVESADELRAWVTRIQSDISLWRPNPEGVTMPVVAVDTETFGTLSTTGLDTRLVEGRPQIDTAGICLCADGRVALYVPINHEVGINLDRAEVRSILQPLFDSSYLVFFNSKFDREVCRLTMGISFRDFPYFEDVQNDNFLLDPKADLDEEVSDMGGNGLKDLSERELGIDQIALKTLVQVKAQYFNPKLNKNTYREMHAPFSWVPTDIATLYAATDALTTWLLWEKKYVASQAIKFPFKVDHLLVDTLTWIERQRFLIDIPRWQATVALHHHKMEQFRKILSDLSGILDFNPQSAPQLKEVLFTKFGFAKGKVSEKTGEASADKSVLEDMMKAHPGHPFLIALKRYRSYASLHPSHLEYDPRDNSARMFFKQCTVAGGRLAAMGGGKKEGRSNGKDDGGFGLNPQAIKGVKGQREASGRAILFPDDKLAVEFDPAWLSPIPLDQLHESILKKTETGLKLEAPDVVNGCAHYMGQWWSFRPEDTLEVAVPEAAQNEHSFSDTYTLTVDNLRKNVDANEVVNLRGLFIAPKGYTLFVCDYSNIEMRVAANVSKEKLFIDEFLTGSGDFHTLTAKAVFPEFSTTKDKVFRKELRALAKIINFALLYGGTEHAIYLNMKTQDPTITPEKAKAMVDKYWVAVPQFAEWTHKMRETARKTLTCTTPDGRIINFRSVLAAEGLTEPKPGDHANVQKYWKIRRRVEELEAAGQAESAKSGRELMDKMWRDPELGIRNASEYKKMIGKFERVAVNAPLQGLAGDLMRRALTLIHRWAEGAGVEGALLVHATVHDEIDFCIKNEYVPYILPRITRLMKLRAMHKACKWPVPIECDCEYGISWDVKSHLTGDDGHVVAAYTRIPGLEDYVPALFDAATEHYLRDTVASGDKGAVAALVTYLRSILHPRVADVLDRVEAQWENPAEAKRCFIAACQLHEYWAIDENEDPATDQTLADYMAEAGLQPFPGLGVHVLSTVRVEDLPPLNPAADLEDIPEVEQGFIEVADAGKSSIASIASTCSPGSLHAQAALAEPTPAPHAAAPASGPTPAPSSSPAATAPATSAIAVLERPERRRVVRMARGLPCLRDLSKQDMAEINASGGVASGPTFTAFYIDGPVIFRNMKWTAIPEKFLDMVEADD